MIAQLRARLTLSSSTSNSPLIASLSAIEVYRWIYYLERLGPILEGRLRMARRKLDSVLILLDAYKLYEEQVLTGTNQSLSVSSG